MAPRPTSITIQVGENPQNLAKSITFPLPATPNTPNSFVEKAKAGELVAEPVGEAPERPITNVNLDAPPDGGVEAWMSVAAVWLVSFITFGVINIWGILQNAFVTDPLSSFFGESVGKIGFVGGCAGGFAFAIGPFSNILVSRVGIHATIVIGVLLVSLSLMLASISTQFWQLLLSEGIMFG